MGSWQPITLNDFTHGLGPSMKQRLWMIHIHMRPAENNLPRFVRRYFEAVINDRFGGLMSRLQFQVR